MVNTNSSTLTLGCTASISGASATTYVIGNLQKTFCSIGTFSFPTGTANGYSPVGTTVTLLPTNPSSLSVKAFQSSRLGMTSLNSVKRYWALGLTGNLRTNLTFNYLDPIDVAGTESSYKMYRWNGITSTAVTPFTLNTAANTMSVTGISTFSDWAIGNLGPSASLANISGRVLTSGGNGVNNAIVTLTDTAGNVRATRSSSFGIYSFEGIAAGETYVVSVTSKRFSFSPRTVTLGDDIVDFDFVSDK